jgi:hypothetical protein
MTLDEPLEVLLFKSILVNLYPLCLEELLVFLPFGATTNHLAVRFEKKEWDPDILIMLKALELIWNTFEVKVFTSMQLYYVQADYGLYQLINRLASVVPESSLHLLSLNLFTSLPWHSWNDLSLLFLLIILRISNLGLSLLLHLLHQLLE